MSIARPEFLWGLLSLVPLSLLFWMSYVQGRRHIRVFAGARERVLNIYFIKSFFQALCVLLAFAAATLAVADIYWGVRFEEEGSEMTSVAFVVDISNSMLANDIVPSRLARTGTTIRGIAQAVPDLWFSLTVFKGSAMPLIPITQDTVVLERTIAYLHPHMMTTQGTDLSSGLLEGLRSFPAQSDHYRIMVLFSDGEDLGEDIDDAVQALIEHKTIVYVVATGTKQGSSIPLPDGGFIRDEENNIVVSAVNTTLLERIAELSGGKLFFLHETTSISALIREISLYASGEIDQTTRTTPIMRYRVFLTVVFVAMLIYTMLGVVKWKGIL